MSNNALSRFLHPELNVGGGDLAVRVLATAVLIVLSVISVPQVAVPYPLLKIMLLGAAELGLMCVMLGMFFRAKTYFAGFQLFTSAWLLLWLVSSHMGYAATVVGAVIIGLGVYELFTKRSRLNALLGVSSYRGTTAPEDLTLLDAALSPEVPAAPHRLVESPAATVLSGGKAS